MAAITAAYASIAQSAITSYQRSLAATGVCMALGAKLLVDEDRLMQVGGGVMDVGGWVGGCWPW